MRVGSCFSGVGGLDLGLHRAGHGVVFQVESNPYRRAVLARHWPYVSRYDDMRTFDGRPWRGRIDLLAGGFPCQDLAKSGRRVGLHGERSSLFFDFSRVANDAVGEGGFVLVENVPALLSSHRGRDFAIFLAAMGELGFHDAAWRILDSRHFGVPQRRRRFFFLGRRGDGRRCATILLEPESGGGNFAPSGEAHKEDHERTTGGAGSPRITTYGQRTAGPVGNRTGGFRTTDLDGHGAYVGSALDAHRIRAVARFPGWVDDSVRLEDPKPDAPRYGAVGDAVTVPVAEWIGRRLALFEADDL